MGHFAKINEDNIVVQVIVAEQSFIDTLPDSNSWIQTSYNTYSGVHNAGGIPLRKNFAAIGYTYDSIRDAFIAPRPYTSWYLDEDTCIWMAPIPCPDFNKYVWDEDTTMWVSI